MKNKKLKVFAIIIISLLMSISFANSIFAAEIPCKPKYFFNPSNPLPGQQITCEVSLTEIKESIAGICFVLEYDAEKIEFVQTAAESGWTKDVQDTTVFFYTANSEGTTKTGKIGTFTFKVKDNAVKSDTTIKIMIQQVALDNSEVVDEGFGEVTQVINISEKENSNSPSGTNNEVSNNDNENSNNNDNTNENNNNVNNNQNEQQTQKPTTSTDVDSNKIVVVNGNKNTSSSTKAESTSKDTSTTNKSLPKTGANMIYYAIAITVALIGMVASFMAYRKYKNV